MSGEACVSYALAGEVNRAGARDNPCLWFV